MSSPGGIYLRESQDRDGDELAISRHRDAIRRMLAGRPDLQAVDEYIDNDVPGSGKKRRPDFERMISDLASGRLEWVASHAWDRLSRNSRDSLLLLDTATERRARILLVNGSDLDLTTPAGRLTADILSSVAANEIRVLGDRRRLAAEQAAHAGTRWPGPRPFGFEPDRVTVRPAEAAALADAYGSLLAGIPMSAVVRTLNGNGMVSPFGNPWAYTGFVRMITNPRYAGLRSYKGEILGPAKWPAIVDEQTWRAVVAIVTDPSRRRGSSGAITLLSAIAECQCADVVYAGASSLRYRVYRCAYRSGRPGPHVTVRMGLVDEYIGRLVVARLSRSDAVDLLVDDSRPDFAELRAEASRLRARLDEIASMLGAGELDRVQARTATARVRVDLDDVKARMDHAERAPVLGDLIRADDVSVAWAGLGVDSRRVAVDALFESIVLHPQGRGSKIFNPNLVEVTFRA